MQINFSDIESFVAEVGALRDPENEVTEVRNNIVRVEIEEEKENPSLKIFYVRAGFMDLEGNLNQFVEKCGREPPDRGDMSGKDAANELAEKLRRRLTDLGVEVRRGAFIGA